MMNIVSSFRKTILMQEFTPMEDKILLRLDHDRMLLYDVEL